MNVWELLVFVIVGSMAALPFLIHTRSLRGRAVLVLILAIVGSFAAAARPKKETWQPEKFLLENAFLRHVDATTDDNSEFVTAKVCRTCHPSEYDSWHSTYHRTMTQVATPSAVLAPFDDVTLESRNRTYLLSRRGDEFWVDMADPIWEEYQEKAVGVDLYQINNPPRVTRRVVMTTGSHTMQGYWIADERFHLLSQIPWMYLLDEQRWVPLEDSFLAPPNAGRLFETWNEKCIGCHSVAGKPRRTPNGGFDFSEISEIGISCESCHGPGEEHVRHYRNPLARYRNHFDPPDDSTDRQTETKIVNPAKLSNKRSSQVCGRCHSEFHKRESVAFLQDGTDYRPGEDLDKYYEILRPDATFLKQEDRKSGGGIGFWSDGTARVGGDELVGLNLSPCYLRGEMSCLSCHSMHNSHPSDQLKYELAAEPNENLACVKCHSEEQYNQKIELHTHHAAGGQGSKCYNCHMPHTTYALFKGIRSHQIAVPKIPTHFKNSQPNACNLCHLDKTLEWTSNHLFDWYKRPKVELPEEEKTVAASLQWLLRGNAVQRAISAWHMSWKPAQEASGTDWQAPFLAQTLNDPYAAVRLVAGRALKTLPNFSEFPYDYVAPENERYKAAKDAILKWNNLSRPPHKQRDEPLLLNDEGRLRVDAIEDLSRRRDDIRMSIPE